MKLFDNGLDVVGTLHHRDTSYELDQSLHRSMSTTRSLVMKDNQRIRQNSSVYSLRVAVHERLPRLAHKRSRELGSLLVEIRSTLDTLSIYNECVVGLQRNRVVVLHSWLFVDCDITQKSDGVSRQAHTK